MLHIGLTGGIGSGKSTVANLFALRGVPVIDADVIAKRVLEPGQTAFQLTVKAFGNEILNEHGSIDRDRLRKQIFDYPQDRKRLEAIVHPEVRREIHEILRELTAAYCIIVIPLLFEAGQEDLVDRILVIDTERVRQIERTAARNGLQQDEISKIIDAQISREERRKRADDIITNNDEPSKLTKEVEKLHNKYKALCQTTT